MPRLVHREKKVILRIRVDPSTDKAMRRIAYREGMPLAQYVREALERDIINDKRRRTDQANRAREAQALTGGSANANQEAPKASES